MPLMVEADLKDSKDNIHILMKLITKNYENAYYHNII